MEPLVSVIVPTKNSELFLEKCLTSIKNQSYKNLEIIVIDNNSTDKTKEIAKKFTNKIFDKGPERSAQRNFGARQSNGEYLLFVDSDMELSPGVIYSCIKRMSTNQNTQGIIIPEESFCKGFWAQCKRLERSFYVGVEWMEAIRFFKKATFQEVGGYSEKMVSGEDWDVSQRVESHGMISRVNDFIYHNEGEASLMKIIKKKFYYAKKFSTYQNCNKNKIYYTKQSSITERYKLFLSNPGHLFKNPILGFGMLFMKTCEFIFGGAGYLVKKKNY